MSKQDAKFLVICYNSHSNQHKGVSLMHPIVFDLRRKPCLQIKPHWIFLLMIQLVLFNDSGRLYSSRHSHCTSLYYTFKQQWKKGKNSLVCSVEPISIKCLSLQIDVVFPIQLMWYETSVICIFGCIRNLDIYSIRIHNMKTLVYNFSCIFIVFPRIITTGYYKEDENESLLSGFLFSSW